MESCPPLPTTHGMNESSHCWVARKAWSLFVQYLVPQVIKSNVSFVAEAFCKWQGYITSRSCAVHCFEGPWMKRTIHTNVPWQASNTQSGGAHILPGPRIESTCCTGQPQDERVLRFSISTSEKCGVWLHCWTKHFESLVGKAWEQDEEGSVWQFLTGWLHGMTPSDASYKPVGPTPAARLANVVVLQRPHKDLDHFNWHTFLKSTWFIQDHSDSFPKWN